MMTARDYNKPPWMYARISACERVLKVQRNRAETPENSSSGPQNNQGRSLCWPAVRAAILGGGNNRSRPLFQSL